MGELGTIVFCVVTGVAVYYGRCEGCATGAARFRERVLELLSPEARAALARREGAARRPAYKFKGTKS